MKKRAGPRRCALAPAHLAGLGALQLAILLALVEPLWALAPLGLFLALVGLAPFFPGWCFFLPIIGSARRAGARVALTFDDGPDPRTTPALLELLARRSLRAAFFAVGERVRAHPELVRRLLEAGHELCNHGDEHDPGLMLRSTARLRRAVAGGQEALAAHGVRPLFFRPPAWITNPRLWPVLLDAGLVCVGARCRARDGGRGRWRDLAARVLTRVRPGDIVGLHDGFPEGAAPPLDAWLAEIEKLLDGLTARGIEPVPLSALLGRPAMEPAAQTPETPGAVRAVRAFYDGLAAGYDEEQERSTQAPARRAEREAVHSWLEAQPALGRVLELGAGTGRFTLELARRAELVTALDLSPAMLAVLEGKTAAAGLGNIRPLAGDARSLDPAALGGPFDRVLAFSVFEYLGELAPVLLTCRALLAPGGRLMFTTARRSLPRFFAQLGNALRQGVWLEARSRGEIARALRAAGLRPVRLEPLGRPCGWLWLVEAVEKCGLPPSLVRNCV